jgi:hypothetical protein
MSGQQTGEYSAAAPRWSQKLDIDSLYKGSSIAACLLAVVGAKFWLINAFGSETPFLDEWTSVAERIFKPFMDGALRISDLVDYSNEHRVFMTRIVALVLLQFNRYWDVVSEMKFNAFVHVAAIGVFLVVVRNAVGKEAFLILCAFVALLFAIPFGWENILIGFQSQFYFLLLFSVASLWFLHGSTAWRPAWWLAILCAIACHFSMASGVITVAAGMGIVLAQMLAGRRRGLGEFLALAAQAALFVGMAMDIPVLPGHAPLKAHSFTQFATAFFSAAGWPLSLPPILASVINYAPVSFIAILTLRERPPKDDYRWFVVGMGGWVILQFVSLAYGRAVGTLASRYLDIMVFGVAVNFLCLVIVLNTVKLRGISFGAAAAIWLFAVCAGAKAISYLPVQIADWNRHTTAATINLSDYLATGDLKYLKGGPLYDIPFPSAEVLAAIVSAPEIRAILPPSLLKEAHGAGAADTAWSRRLAVAVTLGLRALGIRSGETLLPLGVVLFFIMGVNLSASAVRTADAAARPPLET